MMRALILVSIVAVVQLLDNHALAQRACPNRSAATTSPGGVFTIPGTTTSPVSPQAYQQQLAYQQQSYQEEQYFQQQISLVKRQEQERDRKLEVRKERRLAEEQRRKDIKAKNLARRNTPPALATRN